MVERDGRAGLLERATFGRVIGELARGPVGCVEQVRRVGNQQGVPAQAW